jgi:hypothetical protein
MREEGVGRICGGRDGSGLNESLVLGKSGMESSGVKQLMGGDISPEGGRIALLNDYTANFVHGTLLFFVGTIF